MKNRCKYSLLFWGLIVFSSTCILAQESQVQEIEKATTTWVKKETVKAILSNLVVGLEAEQNSQAVSKAMKKFWESAKGLSKKEVQLLAKRYAKASKSSIKKLVQFSPKQLSSYARDIASRIKLKPGILKQIIYREGDRAGSAILKTLTDIDNSLTATGKISQKLLKRMRSEAASLDPKQARAFYDLLKSKASNDWAKIKNLKKATEGIGEYIGTGVDAGFVLYEAYDIYYSDEEPDVKAIKATGKIIDYGISTGVGAVSTALGGGLGPGLVVSLTADRVSTLYMEIAMLQKEREEAKNAKQFERLNNSQLVRRQFLKINNKIKSGDLRHANFLLIKVERFLFDQNVDNLEMLMKLQNELEEKSKKAKRIEQINEIINKARFPYRDAIGFYKKGVELNQARRSVLQAIAYLKKNTSKYPEINKLKALPNLQKLLHAIDTKIEEAEPFIIAGIEGPSKVGINQYHDFVIIPKGGIPYYSAIGKIEGNISDDVVTLYWESPSKPGEKKLTFSVKDCMGETRSISKTVEVVLDESLMDNVSNDCISETYTINYHNNTETVTFKLYTFDEVLHIAEKINGIPNDDEYILAISRHLENTYLEFTDYGSNMQNLKNISALSEQCFKMIKQKKLHMMFHGTHIDHNTGKRLFFIDGKMQKK